MAAVAKIEITVDENGSMAVTGGFQNRIQAFGMLSMAADLLRKQFEQQDSGPKIQVPAFLPPDDILKGPGFNPG